MYNKVSKKRDYMKKTATKFIIGYVVAVAVCIICVYAIPSLRGMMIKTYITERGEINLTDETTGYVIRDEYVFTSKKAGTVKRIADSGKLIKAGTKVVSITGTGLETSDKKYTSVLTSLGNKTKSTKYGGSTVAGYVSYTVDGAEGKVNKSNSVKMAKDKLISLTKGSSVKTAKGKCAAGDPIFKITKNGKWYLILFLENEVAEKYTPGYSVQVDIDGKQIEADIKSVTKLKKNPGESRVVLTCGMFYDGYLSDRTVNVKVTTASATGLLLEDKSIIEKDGKKGVIVKNKLGEFVFKRVQIKADDGKQCVVYQDIFMDEESNFVETLGIYDEIVASPSESDIEKAQ